MVARNSFYVEKWVLLAVLRSWLSRQRVSSWVTYELCYFLLPSVCFCRLQTLGRGADIQQHQARGAGISEWVPWGPAGCLTPLLHCPLPGALYQSKQLRKPLLGAHGYLGFLGKAELLRAWDSAKGLRTCLSRSLFSTRLIGRVCWSPLKAIGIAKYLPKCFFELDPKWREGSRFAINTLKRASGNVYFTLALIQPATWSWVSQHQPRCAAFLCRDGDDDASLRRGWMCRIYPQASWSPGHLGGQRVVGTSPDTTQGDSAVLTHAVCSD